MAQIPQYNSSKNEHPFGMLMPGRSYSSTAYKYGFNGKEKDDEVKGLGNSLDFGARVYDSRLGKWMSIDPLQKMYPGLSPYNFVANSPIMCLDPDGRVITYANAASQKAYNEVYRLASKEFKAKLDVMQSSKVEYHVNVNVTSFTSGVIDPDQMGEVSYEFHKDGIGSRVMVEVKDEVQYKLGYLTDELTGASQYEEGKLGFVKMLDNKVKPIGYDQNDELETKRNELQITEAYIDENPGIGLSPDLQAFKNADASGKPNHYFTKTKNGTKYSFTNEPNTPSYGNKSIGYWLGQYKDYTINGYTFKANLSTSETDDKGNPALSPGGDSQIENCDPNSCK